MLSRVSHVEMITITEDIFRNGLIAIGRIVLERYICDTKALIFWLNRSYKWVKNKGLAASTIYQIEQGREEIKKSP